MYVLLVANIESYGNSRKSLSPGLFRIPQVNFGEHPFYDVRE
jgi:hypothetical protein